MRSTSKSVTTALICMVEGSRAFIATPSFTTKKVMFSKPQTNVKAAQLHVSDDIPSIVHAPGCKCIDCINFGFKVSTP